MQNIAPHQKATKIPQLRRMETSDPRKNAQIARFFGFTPAKGFA